jgi:hypothetical protein
MTMLTKRQLKGWRAAIVRCLKQEKYGCDLACELCNHTESCRSCICNHYGRDTLPDDKWPYYTDDPIGCSNLLFYFYGNPIDFSVRSCHALLHRMIEWVDKELEKK